MLEQAVHPQFLIRKLWGEFIASPIPQATLNSLVSAYTTSNPKYQIRPVIRGILMHPLIFESLNEPNLVKPPIVFMVGVLRQLGAPLRHGGSSNLSAVDGRHAAARSTSRRTSPAGRAACPGSTRTRCRAASG